MSKPNNLMSEFTDLTENLLHLLSQSINEAQDMYANSKRFIVGNNRQIFWYQTQFDSMRVLCFKDENIEPVPSNPPCKNSSQINNLLETMEKCLARFEETMQTDRKCSRTGNYQRISLYLTSPCHLRILAFRDDKKASVSIAISDVRIKTEDYPKFEDKSSSNDRTSTNVKNDVEPLPEFKQNVPKSKVDHAINFVESDMANTKVKSVKDYVDKLESWPKSKTNIIQFKGFNPMGKSLTKVQETRKTKWKCFLNQDYQQIVLYTTSHDSIRRSFNESRAIKAILDNNMIDYKECDLFVDEKHNSDLNERFKIIQSKDVEARVINKTDNDKYRIPVLFVNGFLLGGLEEIQKLNEIGILTNTLDNYVNAKSNVGLEIDKYFENGNFHKTDCQRCEGKKLIICTKCKGTSYVFVKYLRGPRFSMRCVQCSKIGIINCPKCSV
ncbi:hypothetical protein RDWZM_010590 [Blomia tropicalis]|uniref:Glutaredoxin domain-containing protein n=1 Tax=Blomia tropicalis TaxID=40697 RepID=A0A9Q0LYS9_BLOTA|nr:hypothetical protein RDWZM_010590 [Blomia tropicalis]